MQNFSIQAVIQNFGQELFTFLQHEEQTLFYSGITRLAEAKNEIFYLLAFVLKKDKVFLLTHAEYVLNDAEQKKFIHVFERRKKGEPLAYLIGKKEFYGNSFFVDSSTLIPRPDTEILVDEAIQFYSGQRSLRQCTSCFYIMDLGTGTGCILLSFLKECGKSFGYGIDINSNAIALAKRNAEELGLAEKSQFYVADFTSALFFEQVEQEILHGRQIDCLVSNPPYIPDFEYQVLDDSVKKYEPKTALVSDSAANGASGLAHAEKILQFGEKILKSGGVLLIEHGYNQGKAMQALCSRYGYAAIKTLFDLAGNERGLYAIKK